MLMEYAVGLLTGCVIVDYLLRLPVSWFEFTAAIVITTTAFHRAYGKKDEGEE